VSLLNQVALLDTEMPGPINKLHSSVDVVSKPNADSEGQSNLWYSFRDD
jgi:hypothetical protein